MNVYEEIAKDMKEKRDKYLADACPACLKRHEEYWDVWRGFGEIILCACKCHKWGSK